MVMVARSGFTKGFFTGVQCFALAEVVWRERRLFVVEGSCWPLKVNL